MVSTTPGTTTPPRENEDDRRPSGPPTSPGTTTPTPTTTPPDPITNIPTGGDYGDWIDWLRPIVNPSGGNDPEKIRLSVTLAQLLSGRSLSNADIRFLVNHAPQIKRAYLRAGGSEAGWTGISNQVQSLIPAPAGDQPDGGEIPGFGDFIAKEPPGGDKPEGGGAGGGAPGKPPPTDEELERKVRNQYPELAWLLDDPEMRELLFNAVRPDGYSAARFQAELLGTNWWQTPSESARLYDTNLHTAPAEARRLLDQQTTVLRQQALALGVRPSGGIIRELAEKSLRMGWNEQQTQNHLVRLLDLDAKRIRGSAGVTQGSLKQLANEYGVPLNDKTLDRWTKQILRGDTTGDAYQTYLKEQATSLYPSLSGALERGVTVRQYADPYIQIAAEDLGINPDDVDLRDPKWSRALVQNDPKTGDRTAMNLYDWRETIRSDPTYGFRFSKRGNEEAARMSQYLGEIFGEVV